MSEKESKEFINPIDPDKITENPGTLPYAHTVGGVPIRPEDKGKLKGRAVRAMYEQTETQLNQIYEQMELLARQAKHVQKRIEVSERIYGAEMRFDPLIGSTYYVYRKGMKDILSMVSPEEFGPSHPYDEFVAKVKMLADHTWDVLSGPEDL